MRAGGSTVVQQSLTPEASAIVKQAVRLACQRGHAQVSPLHVATTMLSIPTGLLRAACLQSHSQSHPLRCKALDLCFNVALSRLPSSSQILMGPYHTHHQSPSISNALVAAFKRAQAHQRRGSAVDAQQQPILAVRIDVEQLIISILDDPSVSRVMREAGFSSTQVKANLEKAVSLEMAASSYSNPNPNPNTNTSKPKQGDDLRNKEVMTVADALIGRQTRSIVIIGESLASSEGVVRGFMDGTEKGEVPEDLKSLQFIALPLLSFEKMSMEEVKEKVDELRRLVRSCRDGRGIVLYLGDLKWAADYWVNCEERRGTLCSSIESVVKEIGELVHSGSNDFWLMAIATQQTYLRCRIGSPSLETIWGLQPLAIPAVSLDLCLTSDSQIRTSRNNEDGPRWHLLEGGIRNELTSSSVVSQNITDSNRTASVLPPWLLQHREESRTTTINHLVSLHVKDQCKWNSIFNSDCSQHHAVEKTLDFSSVSPSSSSPLGSYHSHQASFHNSKSTSSTETIEVDYLPKFKELNAENLKMLCNSLEKDSCQKEIIPKIASTILQCRSGMMRRKERLRSDGIQEETWLFFLGTDNEAKEKVAKGLAALIFGSHVNFISVGLSEISSSGDLRIKRSRSEASHSYLERLAGAVQDNPHRVFLLEDIDQLDSYSQMGLSNAIRRGMIRSSTGENVSVGDAIMVLSCQSFDSTSRTGSPVKKKFNRDEVKGGGCEELNASARFDLNLNAECGEVDWSFGDVGILEAVDSTFVFKRPDDCSS